MKHNGLPPIPYESRTNRTLRSRHETREMLKTAERVARETNVPISNIIRCASDPADGWALRGIPAIGRGVIGAKPDTRPGYGLE